jgi:ketosteroid isomerase-like protein
MSAQTEVVLKAHAALNAGDMDALVALCDSAVRLDMSDRVLNPAVYEGHDGIRRFYAEVLEIWETFTWEPTRLHEVGGLVLAEVHSRGKGRGSGLELDRDAALLWRVEGGKVVSIVFYRDLARAHAAAEGNARTGRS